MIGAVAAGAAAGTIVPGIGNLAGGIIGFFGGVIGGVVGAKSATALDHWIWDGKEDDIMNCYEFFGWHDVGRNTRPTYSALEFGKAFDYALTEKKHKDLTEESWHTLCMRNALVLMGAMYPESKVIIKKLGQLVQQCGENMSLAIFTRAMSNVNISSRPGNLNPIFEY